MAFDMDQDKITNLVGFSIKCTTVQGTHPTNSYFLQSLVSFNSITNNNLLPSIQLVGSDKAPFQSFHWVHFPSAGPEKYQYDVYASYFQADGIIQLGPRVTINVDLSYQSFQNLQLGFTRDYVSSQAYDRINKGSNLSC
ncbi:MAG: hypothetical protein KGI07_05770 [Thaumarchaeota archaeon]|nr:hypothetical protein [Nitrososphaerota archaeon]